MPLICYDPTRRRYYVACRYEGATWYLCRGTAGRSLWSQRRVQSYASAAAAWDALVRRHHFTRRPEEVFSRN